MQILSYNFTLFTLGGVWRPIEWSSKCSKLLYTMLTVYTLYMAFFFMASKILEFIYITDNIDDFIANSLIFFSVNGLACKEIVAVIRRNDIISLLQMFQDKPHKAYNREEIDIQMKFDRKIRSLSINYSVLCTFSLTGGVVRGILETLEGRMPFGGWIPSSWDSTAFFLYLSAQSIIFATMGTIINVAAETIVLGFCLQVCAQFEILKHRLRRSVKSSEKKKIAESWSNDARSKPNRLSEHVSHHLCIIRLAEMINDIFSPVIFVQFFVSVLVMCMNLYYLTTHTKLEDILGFAVYTVAIILQIFIYCWGGNEIILKSIELGDVVYEMDWLLLTMSERKDLLMIMMRSMRPVKLTSSFLVTLSLDSYSNLLKTSYSAFNVLQQR